MRKSDDGGLLYRDSRPSAFGEGALPATAASNSADGEDPWSDWHRWADSRADARIEAALDTFSGIVGDEIGAAIRELRDEVIDAFRKRDQRIAALEGQISVLLGLLQGKGVVALPTGARKNA